MTERKPPELSFPDWIEHQIRTAESAGAFDNLPGKGKPIAGLGQHRDEMTWIADKMRRENVDIASALPPALALAKEIEGLDARLARMLAEKQVRAHVADVNARIRRALLAPQVGPPVRVRPVDVEAAVRSWRETRTAPAPPRAVGEQRASPPARRRWWRRRSG